MAHVNTGAIFHSATLDHCQKKGRRIFLALECHFDQILHACSNSSGFEVIIGETDPCVDVS